MSLSKARFCVYCRKAEDAADIKTCARCLIITYCSKTCQKAHFDVHKSDCGDINFYRKVMSLGLDCPMLWQHNRASVILGISMARVMENTEPESIADVDKAFDQDVRKSATQRLVIATRSIGLSYDYFQILEVYLDSMYEDGLRPAEMFPLLYVSDICVHLDVGRIGAALFIYKDVVKRGGYVNTNKPLIIASGLAVWLVVWDLVKKGEECCESFFDALHQAPDGSQAKKIQNVAIVLRTIQKYIFGEVYNEWKQGDVESIVEGLLKKANKMEILQTLSSPPQPQRRDDLLFHATKIISRLPWAVQYINHFLDKK